MRDKDKSGLLFPTAFLVCGLLLVGCGGTKTLKTLEGTTVTDLPPVPMHLTTQAECTTSRYSTRCASVPSGTQNCVELLRGESEMQLSKLLGEAIQKQVSDKGLQTVKGTDQDKGAIAEDNKRTWDYESNVSGDMNFRRHESPLFKLGGGQEYAMRTCVVIDEAYYQIYMDMAENAARVGRPELAQVFVDLRQERYGKEPPNHKKVEDVESEIAEHYQSLWKMTSNQN
jgi:hypothetical protein